MATVKTAEEKLVDITLKIAALNEEADKLKAEILEKNKIGYCQMFAKQKKKVEVMEGKDKSHLDVDAVKKALRFKAKVFASVISVSETALKKALSKEDAIKVIAQAKVIDKVGENYVRVADLSVKDQKELAKNS